MTLITTSVNDLANLVKVGLSLWLTPSSTYHTYDISLASRAGPISERVVNPVALYGGIDRQGTSLSSGGLYLEITLFPSLERILQEPADREKFFSVY